MTINRKDNIVCRKIHGSYFLIDISDNYSGDKCSLYEVNQTGMFIWNNIDGNKTIFDLSQLLKDAIIDDIDIEILHNDVSEFVSTLIQKNFLEV
ncbi:hypothetical protein B5F08_12440 [Anaeromassilibacillus sp. An172]|uniref:PqqD family protein n=1 Tax=Anaeromassilibacillus sp. An172 TaxID=1965570 RepID=UPI000B36704C|nr:PqqD family protein [Anaeromassilibacillus sp. An172]OUP74009.1 hypothetical protein B5F08_12440 [Anaeromassilibacillus sp. An172]